MGYEGLERGARLNQALSLSVSKMRFNLADELISRGADPGMLDAHGYTLLHLVARWVCVAKRHGCGSEKAHRC
jgi:hypothetical protein